MARPRKPAVSTMRAICAVSGSAMLSRPSKSGRLKNPSMSSLVSPSSKRSVVTPYHVTDTAGASSPGASTGMPGSFASAGVSAGAPHADAVTQQATSKRREPIAIPLAT